MPASLRVSAAALLFSAALLSAIYFALLPTAPWPGRAVVKAASVALLAVAVRNGVPGRDGLLLGSALAASSVGDLLLDLGAELFAYGLGAFLVAHLFYVALFLRHRPRPLRISLPHLAAGAALAVYSTAMLAWLWPDLGDLAAPVAVYVAVLTAMGIAALWAKGLPWTVPLAALLFVFSDSLIAVGRFKEPIPPAPWLIWSAYWACQFLMTLTFLRRRPAAVTA